MKTFIVQNKQYRIDVHLFIYLIQVLYVMLRSIFLFIYIIMYYRVRVRVKFVVKP